MNEQVEYLKKINTGLGKMSKVKNLINDEVEEINKNLNGFAQSLLTRAEICSVLNITEPTLIKYRKQGMVPFIRLGKSYFYIYVEGAGING